MANFENYDVEDFLQDESFINWVKNPSADSARIFNDWINAHPHKKAVVSEAVELLKSLHFNLPIVEEAFIEGLKSRIDQTRAEPQSVMSIDEKVVSINKNKPLVPAWLKAAAVIIGIIISVAVIYNLSRPAVRLTIATSNAEIKRLVLPDSSEVTLNANSSLQYAKNWNNNRREVWLQGEGFFNVSHLESNNNPYHFTVHTADVDVEVLGTKFNVKNRRSKTSISLQLGKVKATALAAGESIIMNPGDYVVYDSVSKSLARSTAGPEFHKAWMDKKNIFNQTPAREVCQQLKEYYGMDFIIRDREVAEQLVTGVLDLSDSASLFNTLSVLLSANISKKENEVIIERKN